MSTLFSPVKIIRAAHLGMCFGVRDAISLALGQTEPVTILGDLVHNDHVLSQLRSQGVNLVHQAANIHTQRVMITAHGASERAKGGLRERGFTVMEATCPLVRHAHVALAGLVSEGYYPVIVGVAGHVEVRGMTEDLEEYSVVLNPLDLGLVPDRPRFGVVSQTTQPVERVEQLVMQLQARFPQAEVRSVDTVCRPTKQRQRAARELARCCDVVIVVGGAHSNNTRELVRTCGEFCERVYHVQGSDELQTEWLQNARIIGLTAGTSTPDEVIDRVEEQLRILTANLAKLESEPVGQRAA